MLNTLITVTCRPIAAALALVLVPALVAATESPVFNGHRLAAGAGRAKRLPDAVDIPVGGLTGVAVFASPVPPGRRADLARQGVTLLAYVPDGGWLVRVDPRPVASDLAGADVAFFEPLSPALRVSRLFADPSAGGCDGQPVYVHLLPDRDAVRIGDDLRAAGFSGLTRASGGTHVYLAGTVRTEELDRFLSVAGAHVDVQFVEPGAGARLLNNLSARSLQSGSYDGTTPFFDHGIYGSNQVIAVCDTGIDADSCFFRDSAGILPPTNRLGGQAVDPSLRKVVAVDFLYAGDDPANPTEWDSHGHGTRVAGHAAGSRIDLPVSPDVYNGMAPGARLVVQDAGFARDDCADLPGLGCPVTNFLAVLEQAFAHGARIHNNSWGDRENYSPHNTYTETCRDVDLATWSNRDFLVVCAAGNDGADNTVGSPSVAKNAISVAATRWLAAGQVSPASFSSRGWASDGRIKPDVAAPGHNVTSSLSNGHVASPNCGVATGSGTSYSSPMVAGMAALVRDYFAQGFYPTGTRVDSNAMASVSAALVKAVLINGSKAIPDAAAPPPSRDQGWGKVVLSQALPLDGGAAALYVADAPRSFSRDVDPDYRVYLDVASTAMPLRVTLVWSDYPATPGATKHLVNDLDLRVRSPGIALAGNVFSNGWSVVGGSLDRTNNVEQVLWQTPCTGIVEITVAPRTIAVGGQDFALVCSGDFGRWAPDRDDDDDSLPDAWELRHFEQMAEDGSGDFDRDGARNRDEWVAGSDPANPADVFSVRGVDASQTDRVILRWSSVTGRTYAIAASTDLAAEAWGVLRSNLPAVPPLNTHTLVVETPPPVYYRLRVSGGE